MGKSHSLPRKKRIRVRASSRKSEFHTEERSKDAGKKNLIGEIRREHKRVSGRNASSKEPE